MSLAFSTEQCHVVGMHDVLVIDRTRQYFRRGVAPAADVLRDVLYSAAILWYQTVHHHRARPYHLSGCGHCCRSIQVVEGEGDIGGHLAECAQNISAKEPRFSGI